MVDNHTYLSEKNAPTLIVTVIIVIVSLFSWGYWNHFLQQRYNTGANSIYQFELNDFASLKRKKEDFAIFLRSFEDLYARYKNHGRVVALGLEISDYLRSIEKNDEAVNVLKTIEKNGLEKLQHYMVNTRMAALQEAKGLTNEAIASLEELIESSVLFLEEKIYLDLGRLYLNINRKEKASMYFQYVIDKGKDNDILKTAKIFLSEMN